MSAELVDRVKKFIAPEDKIHGFDHILAVVANVKAVRAEPEFAGKYIDEEVLLAAAYLHDIGYFYKDLMSIDSFEHIELGIETAREILTEIEFDKTKIEDVCYLILNHDNPKWPIPNLMRDNNPRLTIDEITEREKTDKPWLKDALAILKEADSSEYTDMKGIERTMLYSTRIGLPVLGNPTWQDSMNKNALSNLLIFPYVAWLNATTAKGKKRAEEGYINTQKWIKTYCEENGISFVPESLPVANS